jgi:hypothetical protein
MVAKFSSRIDNPTSLGYFLFFLVIIAVLYSIIKLIKERDYLIKKNVPLLVILTWLLFAFVGVNGNRMPFPIPMPHRFWAILAIPVALISAEGFIYIINLFKKYKYLIGFVVIVGIILTSFYPKYVVNTSYWPPGIHWIGTNEDPYNEIRAYTWLKTLPLDTKVFTCHFEENVIGFDKYSCAWCPEVVEFKKELINKTAEEVHKWLTSRNYEYFVLGGYCTKEYGTEKTIEKVNEFTLSPYFEIAHQTDVVVIFRIKR